MKATAENVDGAVRELPDANLVRYSFWDINKIVLFHIFKEKKLIVIDFVLFWL